jgi:hypothetical protein
MVYIKLIIMARSLQTQRTYNEEKVYRPSKADNGSMKGCKAKIYFEEVL